MDVARDLVYNKVDILLKSPNNFRLAKVVNVFLALFYRFLVPGIKAQVDFSYPCQQLQSLPRDSANKHVSDLSQKYLSVHLFAVESHIHIISLPGPLAAHVHFYYLLDF